MSNAAAACAVGAGPPLPPPRPPRPPPPCGGCAIAKDVAARIAAARLIDCLTGIGAPAESVRLAVQRLQRAAMIGGRARRRDRDHHVVAHFQRVALDALLAELAGRAPLERPALHHA